MKEYWNNNWQQIFANNKLKSFDALWSLKAEWFEEPNIRRGGWSGVVKIDLDTPERKVGVFIKRQENHVSKTFRHPVKGIATFQKEFHNINQLTDKKVPTLELLYFAQNNNQAILITKELEGYQPLDSKELYSLNRTQKQDLLTEIAKASSTMHHHRFQHNCFYPKHIFVKNIKGKWDVRFIDLEKLKRTFSANQARVRDLLTLYRHADNNWSIKDCMHFFKSYVDESKISPESKKLWYAIQKKLQAKRKLS